MHFTHEKGHIFHKDETGELLAELLYTPSGQPDVFDITHTWVSDKLRGQGIAGKLMEEAALLLRCQKGKANPVCSYAAVWFGKHPDYADVLWEGYKPEPPSCPIPGKSS